MTASARLTPITPSALVLAIEWKTWSIVFTPAGPLLVAVMIRVSRILKRGSSASLAVNYFDPASFASND
jgi:hypothetical protein